MKIEYITKKTPLLHVNGEQPVILPNRPKGKGYVLRQDVNKDCTYGTVYLNYGTAMETAGASGEILSEDWLIRQQHKNVNTKG